MLAWQRLIVCSAHILQQRLTTKKNIERLVEPASAQSFQNLLLKLDSKMRETLL